jgi:hypothetical protein
MKTISFKVGDFIYFPLEYNRVLNSVISKKKGSVIVKAGITIQFGLVEVP